tara:strand:+ start:660 stop:2273 length:1614 start_codon:yes stop_codon:yes gene_type:complete
MEEVIVDKKIGEVVATFTMEKDFRTWGHISYEDFEISNLDKLISSLPKEDEFEFNNENESVVEFDTTEEIIDFLSSSITITGDPYGKDKEGVMSFSITYSGEDNEETFTSLVSQFNLGEYFDYGYIGEETTQKEGLSVKVLLDEETPYEVEKWICENIKTPPETLRVMYKNYPSYSVDISKNTNTPVDVLYELSKHERIDIPSNVIRNPSTPMKLIIEMMEDKSNRDVIARSNRVSKDILIELSKDENWRVRENVAKNPNTPIEVLNELSKDNELVHPYGDIEREKEPIVKLGVLDNKNITSDILESLSKDKNVKIRSIVAEHPKTSIEVLNKLSKDSVLVNGYRNRNHYVIKEAVAKNPNTTTEILEKLSEDKCAYIIEDVVKHPNTSKDVLSKLSKVDKEYFENGIEYQSSIITYIKGSIAKHANTPVDVLVDFSKDEGEYHVRSISIENPNMPSEVLTELSKDDDSDIRESVAKNTSTPIEIIETLTTDEDKAVKKQAKKTLKEMKRVLREAKKAEKEREKAMKKAEKENKKKK